MLEFFKRHRIKLTVIPLILAITLLYAVYQFSFTSGEIVDADRSLPFRSRAENVQQLLEEMQISLNPGDVVNPELQSPLENKMSIEISRAVDISVIDGHTTRVLRTTQKTPAALLKEAGISPGSSDIVTPALDSKIRQGDTVVIKRVEYQEVSVSETIPFYRFLREVREGEEEGEILTKGSPGELLLTYLQKKVNGEVVSEHLVSTSTLKTPIHEFFAVSIPEEEISVVSRSVETREAEEEEKEVLEESPAEEENSQEESPAEVEESHPTPPEEEPETDPQESEEDDDDPRAGWGEGMVFEATAYNLEGLTATGVPSGPGKVATDPDVVPMGTRLYVESLDGWPDYGYCVAADVGGGIIGDKIDLFYESYDTCISFGRRNVRVYILP